METLTPEGVSYTSWPDAASPVLLPGLQIADTELRPIGGVALVNLFQRQILVLHLVQPGLHVFAVVRGSDGDGAPLADAHAKLLCGRLIVRIDEAMANTRAIDNMQRQHAIVGRFKNRRKHTCPRRQSSRNSFRVFFQLVL